MKRKGINTRRHIIEKSLQIFSRKGYFHTSINDILKATGLTKGGLYGHFRSKEEIWWLAYEEATRIWKNIIFTDVKNTMDPLERLKKIIENDLKNYIGANVFEGGCFFLNMLVELSGQSQIMSERILNGFIGFSKLLSSLLKEADRKRILKFKLNHSEVANFIVISLNGATALYTVKKDPEILSQTINQLNFYIDNLKK